MKLSLSESQMKILKLVSTTNLSDACDRLGIEGVINGIHGVSKNHTKIFGRIVIVKLTTNKIDNPSHLGIDAVEIAEPGQIVLMVNEGRTEMACWGGILSTASHLKGLSGVIIDGACRDIEEIDELGFQVYSRGISIKSARNRVFQEGLNVPVIVSGIKIEPYDILVADENGCIHIPKLLEEKILSEAFKIYTIETEMAEDIKSGISIKQVDKNNKYNEILKMKDEK